jgi:hypothetical protein
MNRIARTWELARVSWSVLRADKELMLLPIMSAICSIVVSASFFIPLLLIPEVIADGRPSPAVYVGLFLFYLVNYFVVIFFNTALISAATIRLKGGDPTLRDGLAFAWENVGSILQWAAVAATVGMILRTIEERVGWLGKIIISILGAAWTVATYFVIPVMVYEKVGPFEAIKQSTAMFRKTWGERVVSSVSFGLLFFLLAIPAIAVVFLAASLGTVVFVMALVLAVIYVLTLAVISAALNGIFVAALYQYVHTGEIAGPFTSQMLGSAWQSK